MILCWLAAAFLMTETNFPKIQGHPDLRMLKAVLNPSTAENRTTSMEQGGVRCFTESRTPALRDPDFAILRSETWWLFRLCRLIRIVILLGVTGVIIESIPCGAALSAGQKRLDIVNRVSFIAQHDYSIGEDE